MKVFASGSCRLLTTLNDGRGKIQPIHSMFRNFTGINFLGKLHSTKQHIQFLLWLKGRITLPDSILSSFLTSYSDREDTEDKILLESKKQNIKDAFDSCDCFIFEICSIKLYERDGYQVQYELTDNWTLRTQTNTELYDDLRIIRSLIPSEKMVLFQTHFRPNIIKNNVLLKNSKRETIYFTVLSICRSYPNTQIYDPSNLLRDDRSLYDGDVHFTEKGYVKSFEYIFQLLLSKLR